MTFADSNRASIRYIAESVFGTTPTSGKTRQLRFTSSTLTATKETVVSDELRADRMVSSVPEVGAASEGDINFELSAGSQDDFLQAFLLGAWSRPMTFDFFKGNTVSWTDTDEVTISGGDYTDYFVVGRRVKVEGFVTQGNNGYLQVATVTYSAPDTVITFSTSPGTAEAGTSTSKILDANDVLVLNSANIRLGTAGASTIDSNGNDEFASAIAAGQIVAGQKLYIDLPLGTVAFRNATVTWTGTGADGDQITISDGSLIKVLEAGVDYTTGGDATATALSFTNAVNALRNQGYKIAATAALGVATVYSTDNNSSFSVAETVDGNTEIAVSAVAAGTAPSARGFYTVVSAADDVLTVSPQPPTVASPGATTIKGSMVRNPGEVDSIVPQSFSLETAFNDVTKYFDQNGMRVGTFSLDVSSGSIVTGSMSFMGLQTSTNLATVLGNSGTYDLLDTTATEVLNATTNVGDLTKNGSVLSTAIQALTIEGDASLRNQNAVGSKYPRGIGTGRFNLTGTLTAYFETLDLYNDFLEHNTVSLGFDFTDQDTNVYYFTIPAIKITSDPVNPSGIDQDVMEEMEWSAFRDAATKCMLQVDRFSSTVPH